MACPPNGYKLLTPSGVGGIAVIAVWGDALGAFLRLHFHQYGQPPSCDMASVGLLTDNNETVDECVVVLTGGNSAELDIHASPACVCAVSKLLDNHGFVSCAGETPQMYRDDYLVSQARTLRAAYALAGSTSESWKYQFAKLALLLDAGEYDTVVVRIDGLLAARRFAGWFTSPRRVALRGAPNAGKSTLFNALAGYSRVITSPEAGTTHDIIEEEIELEGFPVIIADAPGMGGQGEFAPLLDNVALHAASRADLVLHAVDLADPVNLYPDVRGDNIVVGCKSDLADKSVACTISTDIQVSAISGENMDVLTSLIGKRLGFPPLSDEIELPLIFDDTLEKCLVNLKDAVTSHDFDKARGILTTSKKSLERTNFVRENSALREPQGRMKLEKHLP